MIRFRKPLIPLVGEGSLSCARVAQPVTYSITSTDAMKSGKGSVTGAIEHMHAAFSSGLASLTIETGAAISVMFVGYTRGSDTAYFEITRR